MAPGGAFGVICLGGAIIIYRIWFQAMPEPPFQNDMRSQGLPPRTNIHATMHLTESPDSFSAILTVTRPEEIPAALAQGKPVLIDIPAFQWRLSLLTTIRKWGGRLALWIVNFLATFLLTQWLKAQLPNSDYVPDWAKFNFERRPDNKVILSPHEE
jgi:hypothetical protein